MHIALPDWLDLKTGSGLVAAIASTATLVRTLITERAKLRFNFQGYTEAPFTDCDGIVSYSPSLDVIVTNVGRRAISFSEVFCTVNQKNTKGKRRTCKYQAFTVGITILEPGKAHRELIQVAKVHKSYTLNFVSAGIIDTTGKAWTVSWRKRNKLKQQARITWQSQFSN